ncbi:nicotinate-nucleotide adenylyltransferase [Eionea flava]
MSAVTRAIGLLGGTFDPVHQGHLSIARYALTMLGLDEVRLVPCHRPPHRQAPMLSSEQRTVLLERAVQNDTHLVVDTRELLRDQASYTVATLEQVRAEVGTETSLVFVMGADAFAQLDTWYQWERIRELSHIAVMRRPHSVLPTNNVLLQWLNKADDAVIVHHQCAGGLMVLQQPELAVSATAIRDQLRRNDGSEQAASVLQYLPDAVREYIETEALYADDKPHK